MLSRLGEISIFVGLIILAILAFSVSFAGIPRKVIAASDQANVTVNVTELAQITLLPDVVTWSSVDPGSTSTSESIQVRNSGSLNISNIYAYTDTLVSEPNNPYPAGDPTAFSSGSVLKIKNETDTYYYTDRLEWNISKPANSGGASCQNAIAWGYFRNVSNEYVWCLVNGTEINSTHGCNSTGTQFYIEQDPDNGTSVTREPDLTGGTVNEQPGWGLFSFSSGPLNGYCVAASQDCTKILIYKYDKRSPFSQCSGTEFLRATVLTPGDEFTINLQVWLPKGIPAGWLNSTWLTIEGS
jgi:hypothetical protein